jgi:hypothetical protein
MLGREGDPGGCGLYEVKSSLLVCENPGFIGVNISLDEAQGDTLDIKLAGDCES